MYNSTDCNHQDSGQIPPPPHDMILFEAVSSR